ncbi:MAG: (d)CMP kinase [Parvularculaceae bacterium]|nr:(d)CMP kinase [Parvularculaceae bacterium]
MSNQSFVVALDGPAASGKGTLAERIAREFNFAHLDTGILYRGVAACLLAAGADPSDTRAAAEAARRFSLQAIAGLDVRTREIGAAASKVAAMPEVRRALLDFQRRFAIDPPGGAAGAVLDGRDIGTVVCPDAQVKFFVEATDDIRAKRRWEELRPTRPELTLAEVRADLAERDARDAARTDAPMRMAEDAELLDTTELTIEQAFLAASNIIARRRERWEKARTGR